MSAPVRDLRFRLVRPQLGDDVRRQYIRRFGVIEVDRPDAGVGPLNRKGLRQPGDGALSRKTRIGLRRHLSERSAHRRACDQRGAAIAVGIAAVALSRMPKRAG